MNTLPQYKINQKCEKIHSFSTHTRLTLFILMSGWLLGCQQQKNQDQSTVNQGRTSGGQCERSIECALGQICEDGMCVIDTQADQDRDGIPDGVDLCPQTPSGVHTDLDGDGIGDVCDDDIDGDGLLNQDDACPLVSSALELDENCNLIYEDQDPNSNQNPQPSTQDPQSNQPVIGYVDRLFQEQGQWMIFGWTCQVGLADSIEIEIYAGGNEEEGTLIKKVMAQDAQEAEIGEACQVVEGNHRYKVPFSYEELMQHAGQTLFVYGLAPSGEYKSLLVNSGQFSLPENPYDGGEIPPEWQDQLPVAFSNVTWVHPDLSQWPITTPLNVYFEGDTLCLDYNQQDHWPSISLPNQTQEVERMAHVWVFMEEQREWYGGIWFWLPTDTMCIPKDELTGRQISKPEYISLDWTPDVGQRLFFMVSALPYSSMMSENRSDIQERSQITEVVWR